VLEIVPMVVSEAYYTLTSLYRLDRKLAAEQISQLLKQSGVALREPNLLESTLTRLQKHAIDFADAYLASVSEEEEITVASFDRDFDKIKGISRYEPTP
jgi:predicted nucleic acid-binding protein